MTPWQLPPQCAALTEDVEFCWTFGLVRQKVTITDDPVPGLTSKLDETASHDP
jgi:hypothetical protein